MGIFFFDPDEGQLKESYPNESQHGRIPPPEFDPADQYIYLCNRLQRKRGYRSQFYHMLKLKPYADENEIPQYHEREGE